MAPTGRAQARSGHGQVGLSHPLALVLGRGPPCSPRNPGYLYHNAQHIHRHASCYHNQAAGFHPPPGLSLATDCIGHALHHVPENQFFSYGCIMDESLQAQDMHLTPHMRLT